MIGVHIRTGSCIIETDARGIMPEMAFGLAGLGDLFVTCRQVRNQTLGPLLGQGLAFGDASAQMKGATVGGGETFRRIHRALQTATPIYGPAKESPLLDAIHAIRFSQSALMAQSASLSVAIASPEKLSTRWSRYSRGVAWS